MTSTQFRNFAIGAVALGVVYTAFKAKEFAGDVVSAVNPTDSDNLANRAASGIVSRVSGGRFLSLGDLFFNLTHSDAPGENGTLDGNGEGRGQPFGIE